jgi:hypothetical protein
MLQQVNQNIKKNKNLIKCERASGALKSNNEILRNGIFFLLNNLSTKMLPSGREKRRHREQGGMHGQVRP